MDNNDNALDQEEREKEKERAKYAVYERFEREEKRTQDMRRQLCRKVCLPLWTDGENTEGSISLRGLCLS